MTRTLLWSMATLTIIGLVALGGCQSGSGSSVRIDPAPTSDDPVEAGPDRMAQAEEAREEGDYTVALALFREILAEDPTETEAYLGIGDVYRDQDNFNAAEPYYERAARIEPKSYRAQSSYGRALQMLERFVEAVRAFHRALALDPEGLEANLGLGTTYLQMDEPETAVAFAEKAVQIDPTNGAARGNLGQVYEASSRIDEAIEQYLVALELSERPGPVMRRLAKLFMAERRFMEAVNTADSWSRLEPSGESFTLLGRAQFKLGAYQSSSEAYLRATELDPESWTAWNGLGVNAMNRWITSGKTDDESRLEARRAFRTSLRLNNNQQRVILLMQKWGLQ